MKNIPACPVCNSADFELNLVCKDHTVSHDSFKIQECSTCGFRFTNPIPEEIDLSNYYESEDYISHSNTSKDLISKIYQIARKGAIKNKFNLVRERVDGSSWLDIGSGTGDYMSYCFHNGLNIKGIEPSDKARTYGVEEFGLEIYPENKLNEFRDESFDAITMWHVLEHVYHLQNRVKKIVSLLRPNGAAFIAVPNCNSLDAEKYKEYWAAYDVPRHLYHFRQEQMKRLWESNGGEVIEVLPMKLDAYYVSLLSEKYKGSGALAYPKALISGLKSNLAAKKSGEWSSLIYVIGKK